MIPETTSLSKSNGQVDGFSGWNCFDQHALVIEGSHGLKGSVNFGVFVMESAFAYLSFLAVARSYFGFPWYQIFR